MIVTLLENVSLQDSDFWTWLHAAVTWGLKKTDARLQQQMFWFGWSVMQPDHVIKKYSQVIAMFTQDWAPVF